MVAMEVEVVVMVESGEKPEDDVAFVTAEEIAETVAGTATETVVEAVGVEDEMDAESPQAGSGEESQEEDTEAGSPQEEMAAESQAEEVKVEKEEETPPREAA
jgi:hypothetical protein